MIRNWHDLIGRLQEKAVIPAREILVGGRSQIAARLIADGRARHGRNELIAVGVAGIAAGGAGSAAEPDRAIFHLPDDRLQVLKALLEFRHGSRVGILGRAAGSVTYGHSDQQSEPNQPISATQKNTKHGSLPENGNIPRDNSTYSLPSRRDNRRRRHVRQSPWIGSNRHRPQIHQFQANGRLLVVHARKNRYFRNKRNPATHRGGLFAPPGPIINC